MMKNIFKILGMYEIMKCGSSLQKRERERERESEREREKERERERVSMTFYN